MQTFTNEWGQYYQWKTLKVDVEIITENVPSINLGETSSLRNVEVFCNKSFEKFFFLLKMRFYLSIPERNRSSQASSLASVKTTNLHARSSCTERTLFHMRVE